MTFETKTLLKYLHMSDKDMCYPEVPSGIDWQKVKQRSGNECLKPECSAGSVVHGLARGYYAIFKISRLF